MNGSVWKRPPSAVMPPVIAPRTTAEPRPVCSPVSDSASDQPMLTPGAERRREPDEQRRVRARGDRRREDRRERGDRAVDQPDERRLHDAQDEVALVGEARAVDQPGDQRVASLGAVFDCVLMASRWTA